jgi:hypothetical protein
MKWILLLSLAAWNLPVHSQTATAPSAASAQPLAHVSSTFRLVVNAPMRNAAPLFGPEGERAWAGKDWNPQFVFPAPARDVEGAIFTVQHGEHTAVWINTVFDLETGRMQYVYVLADLLATTIDVRLHPIDPAHTTVDVTYVRTALRTEANEHVLHMGKHDAEQGPEWEAAIDKFLKHRRSSE